MYRLKEDIVTELEIKKSRFITYLHRTCSEQEAKAFILSIKKEHPNATHHCYAFVIGEHNEIQRNNDDGEPGGTAGVPMLECLLQNEMQDILAVCVRYFGGIKLGAGGLVRAYSNSVANALNAATWTKKQKMHICMFPFSYDLIGKIDYFFRSHGIEVIEKDYGELVTYQFLCEEIPHAALAELTAGQFLPEWIEDTIIDVAIS